MKFTPKTEQEIISENLLEPGIYDFEVVEASEDRSKAGNDMIKLKLKIFTDTGERVLFDYLLESVAYKLRHFCEATGLLEIYEAGELKSFDCLNKSGKLKLGIKKDKTGMYSDQNGVSDYEVPDEYVPAVTKGGVAPVSFDSDDIPF